LGNTPNSYPLQNALTGTIPTELGSLSLVQLIYLYQNELSGTLPTELGRLSALTILIINHNELTGSIPTELTGASAVTTLDLSVNQLSGSIPTQLGLLSKIQQLDLHENELTGSIPNSLTNLTHLTYLDLSSNNLLGAIPAGLDSLLLNVLNLAVNNLTYQNYSTWAKSTDYGTVSSFSDPADHAALSAVLNALSATTGTVPWSLGLSLCGQKTFNAESVELLLINCNGAGKVTSVYITFCPGNSANRAWSADFPAPVGSQLQCIRGHHSHRARACHYPSNN